MVSITSIKNLYDKRFVSAYIRHILADTSISSSASYDGTQAGLAPAYHLPESEYRQGVMLEQHIEAELAQDPANDLLWWRLD